MARPKIQIDRKQFESACGIQCTLSEIAALFDCSEDTIERWCKREFGEGFAEVYKKKSEKGKISLRRNQLRLSETNATMAIWLGKQWLGQRDNLGIKEDGNNGELRIVVERQVRDLSIPKEQGDGDCV